MHIFNHSAKMARKYPHLQQYGPSNSPNNCKEPAIPSQLITL